MTLLRFLTAGESHGPMLTAILEGMIAGLPIAAEAINRELARRQQAYGAGGRMKIERDRAVRHRGRDGRAHHRRADRLEIANLDYKAWAEKDIPPMTIPRPGPRRPDRRDQVRLSRSAPGAGARQRAGDHRARGRWARSARRTWRSSASPSAATSPASARWTRASRMTCPTPSASPWPRRATSAAPTRRRGRSDASDDLGHDAGEGHAGRRVRDRRAGCAAGSGQPRPLRPQARRPARWRASVSIQAIKGVEIGPAFANARLRGTRCMMRSCSTTTERCTAPPTARAAWRAASPPASRSSCARP